ncbi:MAG TPA: sugar phosphate nucleotidyltransferase [Longimicrobiales bacterium]|nr:sugar phosphate nucleotidyltransferase [Longimicrobiales bacterium]
MLADDRVWVVILAGGVGSRFWPVSTRDRPKQVLPLAGDRPLIRDTLERARVLVPDERICILAGEHLAAPIRDALEGFPDSGLWIEPQARGTAPVLAWAAWRLARIDPEAVMVSLHADHLIRPLDAFEQTVETAVDVARRHELLVCLGAVPDRVEPGYGHIEMGEPLDAAGSAAAHLVVEFHEKPDPQTARAYVEAGYLWNTGIFVWKAAVLLDEMAQHTPEISEQMTLLDESDQAFFSAVPSSVIDRAVMERSRRIATVGAKFTWDDVGSWEALSRTRLPDASGNVVIGDGRAVEAQGNVVFSEEGSVVLFGTEELVVVRTSELTLVLPRSRAADLKDLLDALGMA